MTQVAAHLGISDVALKKICDRHRIPSPPRGYWAKKKAGQPVKEIRFVETAEPRDELVVIHGGASLSLPEPVQQIIDRERVKQRPPAAVAAESVHDPIVDVHPAIASTAKSLRKSK